MLGYCDKEIRALCYIRTRLSNVLVLFLAKTLIILLTESVVIVFKEASVLATDVCDNARRLASMSQSQLFVS
jgi:hypothetical protein